MIPGSKITPIRPVEDGRLCTRCPQTVHDTTHGGLCADCHEVTEHEGTLHLWAA